MNDDNYCVRSYDEYNKRMIWFMGFHYLSNVLYICCSFNPFGDFSFHHATSTIADRYCLRHSSRIQLCVRNWWPIFEDSLSYLLRLQFDHMCRAKGKCDDQSICLVAVWFSAQTQHYHRPMLFLGSLDREIGKFSRRLLWLFVGLKICAQDSSK